MIKRKTVETVYEYDKDNKIVRKTITETEEEDTNDYRPGYTPYFPGVTQPVYPGDVYCNITTSSNGQ